MVEDTKLTQLIINELTKAKYKELDTQGLINEDEIYVITDDEVEIKSDGTTIVGKGTTADPLVISPDFIEKVDTEISDRQNAISSLEQSINNTINELDEKLTESDANLQGQITANASDLSSHTLNTSNPHDVTKAQVGLGNVDNTSDANKPISTATQNALDLKATVVDLNAHKNDKNNPHNVTKLQVGLGNVDNTSDLAKPVSTATQAALDEKADKETTYTKGEVDAKVSSIYRFKGSVANQAALPTEGQVVGDTYNVEDTGANYAWTGTAWDKLSETIDLTPYLTKEEASSTYLSKSTASTTYATKDELNNKADQGYLQNALSLKADKSDTYTKSEVDGAIETVGDKVQKNTEDITTLNTNKANVSDLSSHVGDKSNPHNVTKAQVELGNVDNTSDLDKPISTATQSALDEKQDTLTAGTNITITGTTISAKDTTYTAGDGISITDGVISNTRVSAEWGNVTGDITAQEDLQNALDLKANQSTTYTKTEVDNKVKTVDDKVENNTQEIATIKNSKADSSVLSSHTSNTSNPHEVTAEQIGLGNVDNTSDADKPISTETQTALDLKADKSTTYTKSQTDAAIKVVSDRVTTNTASITSINQSVEALQSSKADTTDLYSHTSNASNPHNVTAEQVGLGNVDNTSDADKPISTATQTALNAKADKNSTYTKTEVDAKISSVYRFVGSVASVDKLPTTATVGDTYNVEATGANYAWTGSVWDKLSETIDLTPYLTKSEASATYETIENVGLHTGNKNNPHGVTKAQVGLGNVDNTSDLSKPISTATQAALDLKANQATTYTKEEVDDLLEPKLDSTIASSTYATITNLNAHTGSTSNPHKVTKAQVGLGNVDNTSDANKPVSTAQQAALDKKQNTLTQAQSNAVNSGITAAKVSTYDNYATEIAGKQPAGDYATNTSLSQGLDGKVDKNQGVASAGKVLAVNEQGVVEPTEIKAGGVNATYDATNHRITFA